MDEESLVILLLIGVSLVIAALAHHIILRTKERLMFIRQAAWTVVSLVLLVMVFGGLFLGFESRNEPGSAEFLVAVLLVTFGIGGAIAILLGTRPRA